MKDLQCLLVKCPRLIDSQFTRVHESLALGYLCSALRRKGFQTEILDAFVLDLSIDETVAKICQNECDFIGFTIPDPTFVETTATVAKELRTERFKAHITVGGFTPTFHHKDLFNLCPEINSIVMYEGEETISELANALKSNEDWKGINGIAYKNGDEVFANKSRRLIQDLNNIPFPARDTLPYIMEKFDSQPYVSLLSGRGCYANCNFCAVRSFYSIEGGPSVRFRNPDNIVDEIESIIDIYNLREFQFVDDIFIGPGIKNRDRIFRFARELENRKLNILFSITDRVDNIDYNTLSTLRDIGLRRVFLGLESANQKTLERLNKGITLQDIEKTMQILEDLDLDVEVSFINFMPDNTIEEIEENLDFFLSMDVNILHGLLNRLKPYGGSEIFSQLRRCRKLKGSFPYFFCENHVDLRVNLLYEITKDCFGVFIPVSYNISELKRYLRRKFFEVENSNKIQDLSKLKTLHKKLRDLQKTIMFEASSIFRETIEFVKSSSSMDKHRVVDFKNDLSKNLESETQGWLNMLTFYEIFCLNNSLLVGCANGK